MRKIGLAKVRVLLLKSPARLEKVLAQKLENIWLDTNDYPSLILVMVVLKQVRATSRSLISVLFGDLRLKE